MPAPKQRPGRPSAPAFPDNGRELREAEKALSPSEFLSQLRSANRDARRDEKDHRRAIANVIRASYAPGDELEAEASGRDAEARRQAEKTAVTAWAKANRLALTRLPRAFNFNSKRNVGGVEHDVWFDEPSQRWVKVTKPSFGIYPQMKNGTWTLSVSTPLEYLEKLDCLKEFSGIETSVEGVLLDRRDNPSFIVSQPNVPGRHLEEHEIERHFRESAFFKTDPASAAYYRPSDNTAVLDAHEGNTIEAEGKLIVFDGIVVHPEGELRRLFEQEAERAARRKAPVNRGANFLEAARHQMAASQTNPEACPGNRE